MYDINLTLSRRGLIVKFMSQNMLEIINFKCSN